MKKGIDWSSVESCSIEKKKERKKDEVGWLMISNRISRLEMEPAQPIEGSKRKRPANVILLLSGSDL